MENSKQLIKATADIVSAHVSNNSVAAGEVANLVEKVHAALAQLGSPLIQEPVEGKPEPFVSVRLSVKPDALTCLICGKKQKTLKRHIGNAHGMTPSEYRAAFGLKADYPMVAPEYSKRRSEMAQSIGLGRGGRKKAVAEAPKAKRGRKPKVATEAPADLAEAA